MDGLSLQGTEHEFKGWNKEFEGEIEESDKKTEEAKGERSAPNLG